ncbi:MAG TPA: Asp-tRNA(Asn)/Glu-tRNA(Gln) amidotransferase subunit GatA [Candidatus Saccharimonadales bacterium]|nr:Asp-tRNA(Asn)/Glu-tRNA(Gln) amidotransferase subunit GatA [Candidatus Saccharimonadales bacterium]
MSKWPSLTDLVEQVRTGQTSATELVERSLDTIAKQSGFNAVISTTEKRARARAKEIDDQIKSGKKSGKLLGVPFIAKDNILTFGGETTAASNILKGFGAPYQSTAIELIEAEGGICVAKANLDAFGHGASTENSDFMVTKNPRNISKVSGGSSGGSAAAVILEMVPFALGTDTGGSIRQPAAYVGAVGYKPTYGLVSRSGVIAMASSTDVVGPLTNTVEDAAYILDVIAARDELDSTTIERDEKGYRISGKTLKGAKIGVIKEYFSEGVEEGVASSVRAAISKLKAQGAIVEEVSLPSLPLALASYYIIMPAEVSSNLSRYDGQRFGHTSASAGNLDQSYSQSRSEGFGKEAKRRIMIGTYVISSGYYDAYYAKAQKLRTKLINEFNQAFSKYDFLVGPTAPTVAFDIGKNVNDPLKMYLNDIMTVAANLTGVPSISIPADLSEGLPVGFQIMAPQRSDRQLLNFAVEAEEAIK